ncbi:hypothetical protein LFX25_11515 [Leptospira sp. FAT2]|uniref:hypothetical protein n=1 Tax=Leptospira sanjuanensis TaxID=2879643 RepID=UPI001EE96A03|nr:hypothetical protein [Leptospira sanjuanensis]MCG6168455.1 hypothetical protein [Leptospira sanjuanensis]MCG6193872.1 hypothetical protein [Leptospira sanjuanensis]
MKLLSHYVPCLFVFAYFAVVPVSAQEDPSNPSLSREERDRIIAKQEDRWEIAGSSQNVNASTFGFSILKPFIESFLPYQETVLDTGNLRLKIPANSFSDSKRIEARITVLNNHADFLFAGVPTQIGANLLLESTGMFYLAFYNEEGKRTEPRKQLSVELQALTDPSGSNVYRFSNGTWDLVSSETKATTRQAVETMEGFPFQFYSKIQSTGWWNFDKPKPEFTCLEGKVDVKNNRNFSVQAIGLDYYGMSYANVEANGTFRINVLKDKKVKILVVNFYGGKTGPKQIGFLPPIQTQNKTAFSSKPSDVCQKIPSISPFTITEAVFNDRSSFLKAIDMPDL